MRPNLSMVNFVELNEVDKLGKLFFQMVEIPILLSRDQDSALGLAIDLIGIFLLEHRHRIRIVWSGFVVIDYETGSIKAFGFLLSSWHFYMSFLLKELYHYLSFGLLYKLIYKLPEAYANSRRNYQSPLFGGRPLSWALLCPRSN
jgi:hypothetical protein